MPNEPAPIPPGTVLDGKYRVDRILGGGGMGIILAGRHLQLDQRVAIKVLRHAALADPEVTARFAREAKAAAKIRSEHVARVLDVGVLPDGLPYMVMELLHGSDLAKVVRTGGPLAVADGVDYVLQACEALAEAHAAGIVHRDLKPANLFLSRRSDGSPVVKVLDFGISKLLPKSVVNDVDMDSLTKTAVMMGSPHYMSPEQLKSSRDVDERADIWSLGAVIFRLLTGKTPFAAETTAELCAEILTAAPLSLCAENPAVPPELEAVVNKCLTKSKEARFQSVAELAAALAPFGPPRSRESVDRIVATISSPRLSSVPPPSQAEVPTETAPSNRKDVEVGITATLPTEVTLTTGAASVSAAPTRSGDDVFASEKPRGRRWISALAVFGIAAAVASIAYLAPRGEAKSSSPSTSAINANAVPALPPPAIDVSQGTNASTPAVVSAVTGVASTAPRAPANVAAGRVAAPPAKPPIKGTVALAPSSATTQAPPVASPPAKPAAPTSMAPGVAEFGERK
jgi:eukaryotic-like serine/threonine-protein kinase